MLINMCDVVLNDDEIKFIKIVKLKDDKYVIVAYLKTGNVNSINDVIYCCEPNEDYDYIKNKFDEIMSKIDELNKRKCCEEYSYSNDLNVITDNFKHFTEYVSNHINECINNGVHTHDIN